MVHTFYFFACKPALSRAAFDHYYIAMHTKAGRRVKAMQAYIQNHRIPSLGGDSPYDAMSELWSERPLGEWFDQNAAYPADEENFIDLGRTAYLSAIDRVIVEGVRHSGMIQGLFPLRRRLGCRWTISAAIGLRSTRRLCGPCPVYATTNNAWCSTTCMDRGEWRIRDGTGSRKSGSTITTRRGARSLQSSISAAFSPTSKTSARAPRTFLPRPQC